MPTLATTVDGLKLKNPFVIASGPPGTNLNVIGKAFQEGWGAVIAKTVSLDASKVINVSPRYAKLIADVGKEVVGLFAEPDYDKRIAGYRKVNKEVVEGGMIIPLLQTVQTLVRKKELNYQIF